MSTTTSFIALDQSNQPLFVYIFSPSPYKPHGGLDAAVGEESPEGDGVDALLNEDLLEVGVGEGVEALLALDDNVAIFGSHGVADGRVPGPCQIMKSMTMTHES